MTSARNPARLLEEAWRQVGRPEHGRGPLEGVGVRSPSDSDGQAGRRGHAEPIGAVGQLEGAAQEWYEEVQDQHVRKAVRVLGSLRMAVV